MSISVEDLRHRFTEFQVDGCIDVVAFHDLVRGCCCLGEPAITDGMIMTLFKLLDVSRRGVLNWSEFERLPSLLLSISLKPSHPGDPLPPPGIIEIPPIANTMSSIVRPLRLSMPRVEEGCLSEGTAWARLGLDIEDDICLATRSMSHRENKTQSKCHRNLQRFGKYEDAFTQEARYATAVPKASASPIASTAVPGKSDDMASPEYMGIASVDECVNAWLRTVAKVNPVLGGIGSHHLVAAIGRLVL